MDTQQSNDSLSAATNFLNIGFSYRKAEDFVNAIKFYTKALDCNPNYFNALFNRAFAYDKIGDTSSAIANYEKALESNPSNPFTYYNLGIIYDKMEKHHQAIKYFTQAISISSEKSDFYHNRGLSLRKICNFNELKKVYGNASMVADDRVVFNIMGNKYRLVVRMVFQYKVIQIKWFGTHSEYDELDVTSVNFKKKKS